LRELIRRAAGNHFHLSFYGWGWGFAAAGANYLLDANFPAIFCSGNTFCLSSIELCTVHAKLLLARLPSDSRSRQQSRRNRDAANFFPFNVALSKFFLKHVVPVAI
jgi:hypothetical protein